MTQAPTLQNPIGRLRLELRRETPQEVGAALDDVHELGDACVRRETWLGERFETLRIEAYAFPSGEHLYTLSLDVGQARLLIADMQAALAHVPGDWSTTPDDDDRSPPGAEAT